MNKMLHVYKVIEKDDEQKTVTFALSCQLTTSDKKSTKYYLEQSIRWAIENGYTIIYGSELYFSRDNELRLKIRSILIDYPGYEVHFSNSGVMNFASFSRLELIDKRPAHAMKPTS